MDTVTAPIPEAYQPTPGAVDSVPQPDVQAQTDPSTLAAPGDLPVGVTVGDLGQQDTSANPPVNVDEYLRIKQEHDAYQQKIQEQDGLLSELRRLAEEQKAMAAQGQLRNDLRQETANTLRRAGVEDDDVIDAVTDQMFRRIDETRTQYQQQMTEYRAQVEGSAQQLVWAAHKEGFANDLIGKYGLDAVYLPRLKQAGSDAEMVSIAEALREATQLYKQQAYSQTVQAQEQARRASGVDVITGTTSGPVSADTLKPGKNLDVLAGLLFGQSGD